MAIFGRKNKQLTPEFQDYYQTSEPRSGLAWVLAIATLVAGILLVVGLFFGGRWVYRQMTDDNAATVTTEDVVGGDAEILNPPGLSNQTPQPATNTPSPSSTPSPAASTSPVTSPTPAVGSSIPNTGPDFDL